jgi:hypothetical protein
MEAETTKCECGRTWSLTRVRMPHGNRDDGEIKCPCGRIVKEWNGGHALDWQHHFRGEAKVAHYKSV